MFDAWPRSVGWESGVAVSCGIGRRYGSDPVLLWLWCRLASIALIQPLAWELPYAIGVTLKSKKRKKKEKKGGGHGPGSVGSSRAWERQGAISPQRL